MFRARQRSPALYTTRVRSNAMADLIVQSAPEARPVDPVLLVVGIGASAGGIKALKEFFSGVPPYSGAAYVVILHLSPDHDSKLAEVLQTTAPMPVTQVA